MDASVELTLDSYLGGRLWISQPRHGFRSGIDAVLLAASVPAQAGQRALELGCGVGVASLCLAARVPGLTVTAVEVQPPYADLARLNVARAGLAVEVVTADLSDLPTGVRGQDFDHVLANPPYFQRSSGTRAEDPGRERAHGEATPLADWIGVAIRRLRPGGCLSLIQRTERLPEILAALGPDRVGAVQVLPLSARVGRPAGLFLLRARKGRKTGFRLLSPLILHEGARHERDAESYTPALTAVLREGAPLPGFAE